MHIISTIYAASIDTVDNVATIKGFEGLFENIVTVIIGLAGISFFVMFIMGGFKFITSGGNPKGLEGARNTLTYAILGLVLLALAYLFLTLVAGFTGVRSILNFEIGV
jgi:uncharacterized membrane protein YuzA (DUF378 family)